MTLAAVKLFRERWQADMRFFFANQPLEVFRGAFCVVFCGPLSGACCSWQAPMFVLLYALVLGGWGTLCLCFCWPSCMKDFFAALRFHECFFAFRGFVDRG